MAWLPVFVGAVVACFALVARAYRSDTPAATDAVRPVAPLRSASAAECAPCHAREVAEWERSVMAHAVKSPLFGALESLVEEQVGRELDCPEGAGVLRAAGADVCRARGTGITVTGSGGERWCVNCHSPGDNLDRSLPAWSAGATGSKRGRAPVRDLLSPLAMEGISCASCHETAGPVASHATGGRGTGAYEGNPTWISAASGQLFLARPEDGQGRPGIANSGYRLDPGVLLGASGSAPGEAIVHRRPPGSASAYLRSSEFCGACHDVRLFGSDVLGARASGEHFKRLRNAYSEWRTWSDDEARHGRKAPGCQGCHMSLYPGVCAPGGSGSSAECPGGTHFEARAPGQTARGLVAPSSTAPSAVASHYFTSVDIPLTESLPDAFVDDATLDPDGQAVGLRARRDMLLRHTFRFAIGDAKRAGDTLEIPIEIENTGAGHRVPAGFSQERETWVEMTVRDARGRVVYEVGKVDGGRGGEPADLRDKTFLRITTDDGVVDGLGRPLGLFGADVVDGPDVPRWSPSPSLGGTRFRGRGLINLQNGFLRCVRCIGRIDDAGVRPLRSRHGRVQLEPHRWQRAVRDLLPCRRARRGARPREGPRRHHRHPLGPARRPSDVHLRDRRQRSPRSVLGRGAAALPLVPPVSGPGLLRLRGQQERARQPTQRPAGRPADAPADRGRRPRGGADHGPMSAAPEVESKSWPEIVWSAAVLRGLDSRARADLEAAGELRDLRPGEAVFSPGEPAASLFVVVSGTFALRAIRRGDRAPTLLRTVARGDSFGEEAALRAGRARPMEAACLEAGRVAALPGHVLRRVSERAGSAEIFERLERTLRRAATLDAFRAAGFEAELRTTDLERLLDASVPVYLERGETLYRAGEPPTHAYLVGDGMVQLQSEDDEHLHVRAYLTRGDLVGAAEACAGTPRELGVAASGGTWLVAMPRAVFASVARKAPRLLERLERVAVDRQAAEQAFVAGSNTTQHVFKDLYRLSIARSLLVIDQDHCVRCGHCAWSCADVHDDGVSRLLRRGDKVVAPATGSATTTSLLLPNSCQHCQNPACMIDCPTGAIGRDPRGEVFIREDLCIGCGNCAKGCPWDNIQMAPRQAAGIFAGILSVARPGKAAPTSADLVAVKCDLCSGLPEGPACVAACPTQAIARIQPNDLMPAFALAAEPGRRRKARPLFERSHAATPWLGGAALLAMALALTGGANVPGLVTGLAAGALVLTLSAYALPKRLRGVRRAAATVPILRAGARPWFVAHLAGGVLALGAVVSHAGSHVPQNAAGALVVAFWATGLAGALGALAYRVVPARLSRIERGGALPEDLRGLARANEERIFGALSGRSDLLKAIYARILRPYARAWLGPLALIASGRTLREEQAHLEARIGRVLAGQGEGKLDGLDRLVRLAVDRRALGAQKALQAALRVWHPVHLVGTALVLVLLAMHVFAELGYR
jgi:Fe-S-cluster-containing dehydrogenase component